MAKKTMSTDTEVKKERPVETETTEKAPEPKAETKIESQMSIEKYFQLFNPPIHKYTRSALAVDYRDIMKTENGWNTELKKYTEGV